MPDRTIGKGECMKIATGGALPKGADAVVMFEQTQHVDDKSIEVMKAVAPEENVSTVGEDMRKGEVVMAKGHVLRPAGHGGPLPAWASPRSGVRKAKGRDHLHRQRARSCRQDAGAGPDTGQQFL